MTETINDDSREYLTFSLDNELYAIDVFKVREVMEITKIMKVPNMNDYFRGVINLRGKVIPVADLRIKFNLNLVSDHNDESIVVIEMNFDDVVVGLLVDSVQEVINIMPAQIEPAPKFGHRLSAEFIEGIGKKDEDFIIILNIENIFSQEAILVKKRPEKTGT